MKYLIYFFLVLSFTSCITERKAVDYFKTHPKVSSAFCAIEYPVKETTSVIIVEDTAGARKIQDSLLRYAEKWVQVARVRNLSIDSLNEFVDEVLKHKEQDEVSCKACYANLRAIQVKLAAIPKVDIKALNKENKEAVNVVDPCKDSIITKEVENTAKTTAIQIKLDEKTQALHEMTALKNLFLWIAIALLIVNIIQYLVKNRK